MGTYIDYMYYICMYIYIYYMYYVYCTYHFDGRGLLGGGADGKGGQLLRHRLHRHRCLLLRLMRGHAWLLLLLLLKHTEIRIDRPDQYPPTRIQSHIGCEICFVPAAAGRGGA